MFEAYSNVHFNNILSDEFHIQNGLKQGDTLLSQLLDFGSEYAIRYVLKGKVGSDTEWDIYASVLC